MTAARPAADPLVIVGPTASGKSALAMALAGRHGDIELVTVDSMQVYVGMDIGTATPTTADRAAVPHHLVNVADPADEYDLATFQRAAKAAISEIEQRGRRPVLVGGTALYLRAVVDDLELPGQFPAVRDAIEAETDTAALYRRLVGADPVAAARMEPTNRRRIVRALEVTVGAGRPFSDFGPGLSAHPPTRFRMLGLRWDLDALDERIAERYRRQVEAGFVAEVERLAERDRPLSRTAAQALGYRELGAYRRGECTLDEALDAAITRTRRFARRQMKWFQRDPRITWIDGADPDLVETADIWAQRGDLPPGTAD